MKALKIKQAWDFAPSGKVCGGCTACCHVVPVDEPRVLKVRAFQGCPHVSTPPAACVGCGIYATRPRSCVEWNCQWLGDAQWADEYRPDRCGVVIDILPDTFRLRDGTRVVAELPALQFWVLPGHEEDWRDKPAVMDLIYSAFESGYAVLWRTRDPVHGQKSRALWRDKATGQWHHSEDFPPFMSGDTAGERARRALQMVGTKKERRPARAGANK